MTSLFPKNSSLFGAAQSRHNTESSFGEGFRPIAAELSDVARRAVAATEANAMPLISDQNAPNLAARAAQQQLQQPKPGYGPEA